MITFTQNQAGFSTEIEEEVLYVDMTEKTKLIVKKLERDLVVEGKDEVILADTPVKLMQKLHQLWSGTVKFESGNSMTIDTTKAEFIKSRWHDKKIGVFYKFKEELSALSQVFLDNLTTDLEEFDNGDYQVIALQIVSGREGISLRNADYIIFYNIDFSATSYFQAKDRMTTMERKFNKVYWVFSNGGIEDKIYKAVKSKKSYTLNIFKKDYERI
jgi:aspartate/glutamate racemase